MPTAMADIIEFETEYPKLNMIVFFEDMKPGRIWPFSKIVYCIRPNEHTVNINKANNNALIILKVSSLKNVSFFNDFSSLF